MNVELKYWSVEVPGNIHSRYRIKEGEHWNEGLTSALYAWIFYPIKTCISV
jgi:hypothetical protein